MVELTKHIFITFTSNLCPMRKSKKPQDMFGIQKTKYDFPAPGSRKVPKFKGHYSQLDDFFENFEIWATSCNLTNEDKFKFLPKYVSSNIYETIEGMQEFKQRKDWDDFVNVFKEL
ncbi:hypothetical protein M422DRAFT_263027 [Sphaerobolus stellatus SS14]|uniref:Uncharacterized protein n=1 Tax=Sphaerobolus stellatus (strain SS14) TaxID=990650 RepID=A0A0C9VBI2_SPHS4|nr:hypothetical protein M422DRAFT_263027 [Sphaerobolus stellatus SS14]